MTTILSKKELSRFNKFYHFIIFQILCNDKQKYRFSDYL
jgi:hypothetical protein